MNSPASFPRVSTASAFKVKSICVATGLSSFTVVSVGSHAPSPALSPSNAEGSEVPLDFNSKSVDSVVSPVIFPAIVIGRAYHSVPDSPAGCRTHS